METYSSRFLLTGLFLIFISVQAYCQNDTDQSVMSSKPPILENKTSPDHPGPENPNSEVRSTSLSTTTTSRPQPPPPIVPTPPFPKNMGNWSVNYNSSNSSCIRITGAIQLRYNPTNTTSEQIIDVPTGAEVHGTCENGTQSLNLQWLLEADESLHSLEFNFTKNFTTQTYAIQHIQLFIWINQSIEGIGANNSNSTFSTDGQFFSTPLNHSFVCASEQKLNGNLKVHTANFRYEAFMPTEVKKSGFSDPQPCSADNDLPNQATTVVGIVLGSILLISLAIGIGSFIGVRYGYFSCPCCKRSSGYQRLDI